MNLNIAGLTEVLGWVIYSLLALVALWGLFSVVMAWRRVAQVRFRNEVAQDDFLDQVERSVAASDFESAQTICEDDGRAMPQLVQLAIENRNLGSTKLRHLVADRFQRDVMSDLEHRLSWVQTVIKSAPMIGLFGTVIGMMGAFASLGMAEGGKVDATNLSEDISLALITTACGLAIAIPLVLAVASINIRIRRMEDLVGAGLTRFFDIFRSVAG